MKDSSWCKQCGEFKYSTGHKCPPVWETNIPDYDGEDDWIKVYARTPEVAAIKRAEKYDEDDYDLVNGCCITVVVRVDENQTLEFNCAGETAIEYSAKLIPKTGNGDGH